MENIASTPEVSILPLFPHRFDFIRSRFPEPGKRPEWETESRYPLSDRRYRQGKYLYGVSFDATTAYALLDIDPGSAYHPQRDHHAIRRIIEALEPLGITDYVLLQSSDRQGIHVYLPFQNEQVSWAIGLVLQTLLFNAGFSCAGGQLEVFPNPKPFSIEIPTSYKAHRLPLQIGSYLLDDGFNPVSRHEAVFVQRWQFAQSRNYINEATFQQVLANAKQQRYRVTGNASKYLGDLTADIETGWTGRGQTNELLRTIAKRERIFHHIMFPGTEPLSGQALVGRIVEVARACPGYQDFCAHQHEIYKRAAEWARSVERQYYPYGAQSLSSEEKPTYLQEGYQWKLQWNDSQSDQARQKIQDAIRSLLETEQLPSGTTARVNALTQFGISSKTLYRHRDLWHPKHFQNNLEALPEAVFYPVQEVTEKTDESKLLEALPEAVFYPVPLNEFVGTEDGLADCVPQTQQSQASPSSIPQTQQGGVRGGNFATTPTTPDIHQCPVPDLDRRLSDLLLELGVECTRLVWTSDDLAQYALDWHGKTSQMMSEVELDALLLDLRLMK